MKGIVCRVVLGAASVVTIIERNGDVCSIEEIMMYVISRVTIYRDA